MPGILQPVPHGSGMLTCQRSTPLPTPAGARQKAERDCTGPCLSTWEPPDPACLRARLPELQAQQASSPIPCPFTRAPPLQASSKQKK